MNNKAIYLAKEGVNEPPGHPQEQNKPFPMPKRKNRWSVNSDEDYEERRLYAESLVLLKEEKQRKKQLILDQQKRYK